MVSMRVLIILLAGVSAAAAQDAPHGNWQTPGEIQKPGDIQTPSGTRHTRARSRRPARFRPGEIQRSPDHPRRDTQPKGPWIKPGEIQAPKASRRPDHQRRMREPALRVRRCAVRLRQSKPAARRRGDAAGGLPEIARAQGKPAYVEGHTDGKGSDAYNMKLSEARGRTVRDWLGANGAPGLDPDQGLRQAHADRSQHDDRRPRRSRSREKNRRVEIVFETCKIEPRLYGRDDEVVCFTDMTRVPNLNHPTASGRGGALALSLASARCGLGPALGDRDQRGAQHALADHVA